MLIEKLTEEIQKVAVRETEFENQADSDKKLMFLTSFARQVPVARNQMHILAVK